MLTELIVVNRGGASECKVAAHSIILPDIRLFLPYVEDGDLVAMLMGSQQHAERLLVMIRTRRNEDKNEEMFRIDVPDLWALSTKFPAEEREIVRTFWFLLDALAHHFLPWAEVSTYGNEDGEPLGKRYIGLGWWSPAHMEAESLD